MRDAAGSADQEENEEAFVPKESPEPSLLDFAIARIAEDGDERQAMKAVAAELGVGGSATEQADSVSQ